MADVTYTLGTVPRWTLDATNGAIAQSYLTAAGITLSNFPGAYTWKSPGALDCCDDLYVMPHADPTWATHSNLFNWNQSCRGSIWAACHAVSALENSLNPANTSQQMNFLSTKSSTVSPPLAPNNSLQNWATHAAGTIPYTHRLPSDPIAQYIGITDLSQTNGSEQIYLPKQSYNAPNGPTRWRPGVKIISYDPSQANVSSPDLANGNVAASIVYGRAFDNSSYGWVMYESGHSHLQGTSSDGPALRAFFNFSFFQGLDKAPQVTGGGITGITSDGFYQGGTTLSLNIAAIAGLPTTIISSYEWRVSVGGASFTSSGFSPSTGSPTTSYLTPVVGSNTEAVIQVKIIDNCGRTSFAAIPFTLTPPPAQPVAVNDLTTTSSSCIPGTSVSINTLVNDSDPLGLPFSFTSLILPGSPALSGTWTNDAAGNVTFSPDPNFSGAATVSYYITNSLGIRDTAIITVNVGTTDAFGCASNQVRAIENSGFLTTEDLVAFGGTITAAITVGSLTDPRLDDVEGLWASSSNTVGTFVDMGTSASNLLDFQLPVTLQINDTIVINWGKRSNSGNTRMAVYESTTSTFSGAATNYNLTGSGNFPTTTRYPISVAGTNYIRIRVGAPGGTVQQLYLDGIQFEDWNCVSRKPQLINDNVTALEDAPTIINVLSNDADPAGLVLTMHQITSSPTKGKVSINTDGTITYISNRDTSGTDVFTYEACNSQGYCSTATVTLTIIDDLCASGSYKAVSGGVSTTKVFQRGFAGTNAATANSVAAKSTDSWLDQNSSTTNKGNDTKLHLGKTFSGTKAQRPILFFNTSEIPNNSIVQSAVLGVKKEAGKNNTQVVRAHKLTNSWTETGTTWVRRNATPLNWTTSGADFNSTVIDSESVNGSKIFYYFSIASTVQGWVTDSTTNFGVLLKTAETLDKDHQFTSNEGTTVANRPQLSITYIVPTACTSIPNRNPLANPDYVTTINGQSVIISPLNNDADIDPSSTYTITGVIGITAGSATFTATNITYTANTSAIVPRTERLSYIITDNAGAKDTAYVYISVTNAPPLANRDNVSTNSGTAATITVMTNDSDPEGGTLSAPTISLAPTKGTAVVSGNNIIYTPGAGYTGKDTLIYQICETTSGSCSAQPFCDTALVVITVNNQIPTANNDTSNFSACQTINVNLITNDSDPEGGVLTVNVLTVPNPITEGAVTNNNDGTITFVPVIGAISPILFTYSVTDNGVTPQTSATKTVRLVLSAPANTAPTAANDNAYAQYMGEVIYVSILDNDFDAENNPLSPPTITVAPTHGTAVVLSNGLIKYIANPGYYGTDVLTYQICDSISNPVTCAKTVGLCDPATVTVTILAPLNSTNAYNDEHSTWMNENVSSNVLLNDYDAENNTQEFKGFFDQSTTSYITNGSFTVYAEDGVTPAGVLSISVNGDFTLDPLPTFTGVVSIPYFISDIISDGSKATVNDTAILKITVNQLSVLANSIIANNDENITQLNITISNSVFYNDRDPQNNSFSLTSFTFDSDGNSTQDGTGTIASAITIGGVSTTGIQTNNAGAITINADGTYTFNPQNDFTGSVDIEYTICDNVSPPACQKALLHIDVLPDANGAANDAPFAADDFAYTNVNTAVSANALLNDRDPNSGNLISATAQTTSLSGVGTFVLASNGAYTFTPVNSYTGTATFTYVLCDNQSPALCSDATIHFLVGVYNSTNAMNDENNTWLNVNVAGSVLTNDYDVEGNSIVFGSFLTQNLSGDLSSGAILSGYNKAGTFVANAGNISFDASGNYVFDPSLTFTGNTTVPYRICDNGNQSKCDTAYLTISVDSIATAFTNIVIANNDENISYGAAVGGSLVVNDRNPKSYPFSVSSFTGGVLGTAGVVSGVDLNGVAVGTAGVLLINSNGSYLFTPTTGFIGSIDLPYIITDSLSATATAKLHIDVLKDPNGVLNNPPFAADDFSYTTTNQPISGSFISNDNDPNSDSLSIFGVTISTGGPHTPIGSVVATRNGGTIQFYTDGQYTYMPASGYSGPDFVNYTICDVTIVLPQPLCASAKINILVGPGISIAGQVWDDANGSIISNVGEAKTNVGNTLYVSLVNSLGNVLATTMVDTSGNYVFNNLAPSQSYALVLSTTIGVIGAPAPTVTLPSGWVNTQEARNGLVDSGTIGVIDLRPFGFQGVVNYNFGIEQLPNSTPSTFVLSTQPPAGQLFTLNGGINPPVLSGTDPEDGILGANKSIVIRSIPTNSDLLYNGVLVTNGQTILNFNAALLQIQTTSATLGSTSTSFLFAFLDSANKQDPTPATYEIAWAFPLPVVLVSFEGKSNLCDVLLSWETAVEINSDRFEIEQSKEGYNFYKIQEKKAIDLLTGGKYNETVVQPSGTAYYRLKMIDKDETFKYSKTIAVTTDCNETENMSSSPNPVITDVTLHFQTMYVGIAELQIRNTLLQKIDTHQIDISNKENHTQIDMSALIPGVYFITLEDEKGRMIGETQKVIKQ